MARASACKAATCFKSLVAINPDSVNSGVGRPVCQKAMREAECNFWII